MEQGLVQPLGTDAAKSGLFGLTQTLFLGDSRTFPVRQASWRREFCSSMGSELSSEGS